MLATIGYTLLIVINYKLKILNAFYFFSFFVVAVNIFLADHSTFVHFKTITLIIYP